MRTDQITGKLRQLRGGKVRLWLPFIKAFLARSRTNRLPCLFPFASRIVMVPREDFYESYWYFCESAMGRHEIAYFLSRLRFDDVFLDIGGFRGAYTMGAKAVFPQGTLQAWTFEPLAPNARRIRDIVSINDLPGVNVTELAIGDGSNIMGGVDRDGMLRGGTSVAGSSGFATQSLDAFVRERKVHPTIIKLDVEGFEREALRGATDCLRTQRPRLWVELHPECLREKGTSAGAIMEKLESMDYRCTPFDDASGPDSDKAFHAWAEPA